MIGDFVWRLWFNFIFRTERIGNVRRVTNRFNGDFRLYKMFPLERVGVHFTAEQTALIAQLFRDDMVRDAQQIILREIETTMSVDGLGEAMLQVAEELENGYGKHALFE